MSAEDLAAATDPAAAGGEGAEEEDPTRIILPPGTQSAQDSFDYSILCYLPLQGEYANVPLATILVGWLDGGQEQVILAFPRDCFPHTRAKRAIPSNFRYGPVRMVELAVRQEYDVDNADPNRTVGVALVAVSQDVMSYVEMPAEEVFNGEVPFLDEDGIEALPTAAALVQAAQASYATFYTGSEGERGEGGLGEGAEGGGGVGDTRFAGIDIPAPVTPPDGMG